jgi:nucleoid-associated protein YgaU
MQGRNASLIVAAALGWTLAGCAAKKDPAQPASPAQWPTQLAAPAAAPAAAPQPAAPTAPAAKAAPAAPATEPAAAAAPAAPVAPAAPKPPPAPEPAAIPGGKTYTIKPGDNLWKISKEVYGDATKYPRIIEANPGLNPDNMKVGTKIVIP